MRALVGGLEFTDEPHSHTGSKEKHTRHQKECVRGWWTCMPHQYSQLMGYNYHHICQSTPCNTSEGLWIYHDASYLMSIDFHGQWAQTNLWQISLSTRRAAVLDRFKIKVIFLVAKSGQIHCSVCAFHVHGVYIQKNSKSVEEAYVAM